MLSKRWNPLHLLFACIALLVVIACGSTGTVSVGNSATPTATATAINGLATEAPTVAATTPPNPTSCASLIGSSAAASAGSHFTDVAFPSGSVSTSPALHLSGTGLWSIYLMNACTPNSTANAVRSFFASQLPSSGWAISATLPFDGGYQAPCGDPYCWAKDTAPRYVGLESVTDAGNGFVTYRLRLFIPPAAPASCYTSMFANPPYQSFWWDDTAIPVPPLSINAGPGETIPGPPARGFSYVCSAGTMSSIQLFMQTELTRLGYHVGTLPCYSGTYWVLGKKGVTWDGTDPTLWRLSEVICP